VQPATARRHPGLVAGRAPYIILREGDGIVDLRLWPDIWGSDGFADFSFWQAIYRVDRITKFGLRQALWRVDGIVDVSGRRRGHRHG
jgi:hypothetical protein